MIVRSIDNDNDWVFGKGRNDYKKDLRAVSQNIKTRLQSFFGDCFFDLSGGIDWFNLLGANQESQLRLAVSATILNTEGVTKISLLNLTLSEDRRVLLQYGVLTEYGTVTEIFDFNNGVL